MGDPPERDEKNAFFNQNIYLLLFSTYYLVTQNTILLQHAKKNILWFLYSSRRAQEFFL